MKIMTRGEIEACRTIGRHEPAGRTTIGLVELDALCDTALVAVEGAADLHLRNEVMRNEIKAELRAELQPILDARRRLEQKCQDYHRLLQEAREAVAMERTNGAQHATWAQHLEAANDRLWRWVQDLQGGMSVNCVHCGHHFEGVGNGDLLRQHVMTCPKHPLAAALQEVATQALTIEKLRKDLGAAGAAYRAAASERADLQASAAEQERGLELLLSATAKDNDRHVELSAAYRIARAEIEELRRAVSRCGDYVAHQPRCAMIDTPGCDTCTCGYGRMVKLSQGALARSGGTVVTAGDEVPK